MADPAIQSVRVFSSGWTEQHEEHRYGSWKPRLWRALMSKSWVKIPINYFLIQHRKGLILFDTGLDPAIVSDSHYITSRLGRFLLKRIFRLHLSEKGRIDRILARSGDQIDTIGLVVISHLHFDHVGGIAHTPNAQFLVSQREWAQLSEPHPEHDWILREHIELPAAQWRPISFRPIDDLLFEGFEGIYDVMGDGTMVLLPTPGHTAGSLSMLIRRKGWAPILLVGDLTYDAKLLKQDIPSSIGDGTELRKSFAKVRKLKERLPDLVIVPSHDFAAAETIERTANIDQAPMP